MDLGDGRDLSKKLCNYLHIYKLHSLIIRKSIRNSAETLDFTSNPRFEEDCLYPKEISEFKEAMMAFRKQSKDLMIKLLRSLGEYLELADKDFFLHQHRALEDNYEKSKCSVRSVFYPKELHNRKSSVQLRLPEHQDFGTINLIRQSAEGGGLQAKLRNGKWVDVPFIENSFVLLAARCLEMYSGGNIPAVVNEKNLSLNFYVSNIKML